MFLFFYGLQRCEDIELVLLVACADCAPRYATPCSEDALAPRRRTEETPPMITTPWNGVPARELKSEWKTIASQTT